MSENRTMIRNDKDAVRRFGHYEAAARAYCKRRDIDPSKIIQHGSAEFSDHGSGFYTADLRYTEQWLFVARRLADFEQRLKDETLMREILEENPASAPHDKAPEEVK